MYKTARKDHQILFAQVVNMLIKVTNFLIH